MDSCSFIAANVKGKNRDQNQNNQSVDHESSFCCLCMTGSHLYKTMHYRNVKCLLTQRALCFAGKREQLRASGEPQEFSFQYQQQLKHSAALNYLQLFKAPRSLVDELHEHQETF